MTKISNQYSLTNILTADLANSRLGINNVSPTVALDVTGAGKFSSSLSATSYNATTQNIFAVDGTERMRITSAGYVLIGRTTSTPAIGSLEVEQSTTGGNTLILNSSGAIESSIYLRSVGSTTRGAIVSNIALAFDVNGPERMRIASNGNIGIGTSTTPELVNINSSASAFVVINGGTSSQAGLILSRAGTAKYQWVLNNDDSLNVYNYTTSSINLKITSAGYFWVNNSIPGYSNSGVQFQVNGESRFGRDIILHNPSNADQQIRLSCNGTNSFYVQGALSKNSGSFRIDHPLKPDTHQLVHSFIEGPQADLIYRGKLTLVNGKAQANIDEVSTMTEGTFKALCREVQCFTTNENGWDLVKGKVIGNIIYIESQNPNSTDEISWMVIGERKDKHMMDTGWTDEQGKVIVEPLKQK